MHIEAPPAPSPPRRSRTASTRRLTRQLATAALLGSLAGAVTTCCLGAATYRATAVVQVPDADPSTRLARVNGAIAAAVSKPVIARAAASLVGAGVAVPSAGLGERLALAAGVSGQGVGRADRLVQLLSASVATRPGPVPGTLEVSAAMPDGEGAALAATGVAEAFVAEQDDLAAQTHHRVEAAAAARFEVLRVAASSAHAKLSALEGDGVVATRVTTDTADLAAATARRDAIARIVASGSPPLGEGKGMPAAVDALQTIYLDQVKQLAKARETLGDRHTTVVSLNEAVQRAAAALTGEWRRLKVAADADVNVAQGRQDAARREAAKDGDARADGVRQAALAEARGAARAADAALARADAASADVVEAAPYRVVVRASVPTAASGIPPAGRIPLVLLAGLLAAALPFASMGIGSAGTGSARVRSKVVARRAPSPAPVRIEPVREPVVEPVRVPVRPPAPRAGPVLEAAPVADAKSSVIAKSPVTAKSLVTAESLVTLDASVELAELQTAIAALSTFPERTLDMPFLPPALQSRDQDTLRQAMRDVLPGLAAIEPRHDAPPTVLVAANEIGITTMETALSLGHVAAAAGYRVLVIEGARPRAALATAADPEIDPILVELSGGLRVALRAEGCAGVLFLAPCFKDGSRIAAALARSGETPFVDDVADEFDLVVIDGGRAADHAAADWDIDLAVRVARFASQRDDDRFLATLDLTPDAFLGTMAGSNFVPRAKPAAPLADAPVPEDQPAERPAAAVPRPIAVHQPARAQQPSHAPSTPFQPSSSRAPYVTARRRVGLR